MLQTLKIENVALIDKATIELDKNLNVISGETGAGKSIMLDSLGFVFGGRADRSLIREGANSMKVEAIFNNLAQSHIDFIKELGIDFEDELFISRSLDMLGKNVCKINGELVPVAVVKKICSRIIDIHGQSEHLAILNNDYQLEIIDLFSHQTEDIKIKLAENIEEYKNIEKDIQSLGGSEKEKQNLIDLYTFQINEIDSLNIKENEYEDLLNEKREMSQFEKINLNLVGAYDSLTKSSFSDSSLDNINTATKSMQNIIDLNQNYQNLYERLNSAYIELSDIADTIKDYIDNNTFDEARFNYVDERIDAIKSAFRKYGGDYENLKKYYEDIVIKLDNLKNGEERRIELIKKQEDVLSNIDKLQDKLNKIRVESAKKLSDSMQIELTKLGMKNARLEVEFSRISERFSYSGYDRVEFMFSSNLGFQLKPLNKVVSGGEMSRVMLAYKIVVGEVDTNETIIFDEIDTGLSGQIASVVAEYLARLSRKKQVVAVSHLPQICAMADNNIKVEKYSTNNTTKTKATILEGDELYSEIARLMGATANETGKIASIELKEKSNKFKESL